MSEQVLHPHGACDTEMEETLSDEGMRCRSYECLPVSCEQRRSYRYPAQPGRDGATLQHGRRTWNARLCEESAGGMAVELAKRISLNVNDQMDVGIYTGWYRTRIVHMQLLDDGGLRMGLQRISVLANPGQSHRVPKRRETGGTQVRNLVAVAFVAMVLGVGVTSYFKSDGRQQGSAVRSRVPTNIAGGIDNSRFQNVLAGVHFLLQPEVAQGLELSREQQQSIQGVLLGTSNSLGKAYEESKDQPPHVWYGQSQQIVDKAVTTILCSLTDEQILKWRNLMLERRSGQETS